MEISNLENQLLELQNIKSKAIKELNYDLAANTRNKITILSELIKKTKFMRENLYVLGSAKSNLNLKSPGPTRNLELDVLRLIYFINHFADKEIKVFGVMLVYNEEIKKRILDVWLPKYSFNKFDYFKVITFENEPHFLINEKEILFEKQNNSNFNKSEANLSKEVTEQILTNELNSYFKIENLHKIDISDFNGLRWDFYKLFRVQ